MELEISTVNNRSDVYRNSEYLRVEVIEIHVRLKNKTDNLKYHEPRILINVWMYTYTPG